VLTINFSFPLFIYSQVQMYSRTYI